jgi:tetratricopeptide (TPR) repeat protein
MGKIIWESGGLPGASANIINNLTKHQLLIWLDNKESSAAMDNIFGALYLINGKTAEVKKAKKDVAKSYGYLLMTSDKYHAFAGLIAMSTDTANYTLNENELNALGYELYEHDHKDLALEAFRSALAVFPNSDNLYNSYGELLAKSGKKEEGVIMYKKSLLLNPKNEDSRKALDELEKSNP